MSSVRNTTVLPDVPTPAQEPQGHKQEKGYLIPPRVKHTLRRRRLRGRRARREAGRREGYCDARMGRQSRGGEGRPVAMDRSGRSRLETVDLDELGGVSS